MDGKVRRTVVFDNVFLKDPCTIMCKISYWMSNSACLQRVNKVQPQVTATQLLSGAGMKISVAANVRRHRGGELEVKLKIIELVDQVF
jgi:hypothetical protein